MRSIVFILMIILSSVSMTPAMARGHHSHHYSHHSHGFIKGAAVGALVFGGEAEVTKKQEDAGYSETTVTWTFIIILLLAIFVLLRYPRNKD